MITGSFVGQLTDVFGSILVNRSGSSDDELSSLFFPLCFPIVFIPIPRVGFNEGRVLPMALGAGKSHSARREYFELHRSRRIPHAWASVRRKTHRPEESRVRPENSALPTSLARRQLLENMNGLGSRRTGGALCPSVIAYGAVRVQ